MIASWKVLFSWHKNEKGQVLLITILAMVVALTVGLSVVSRSVIQIKTSKDEADSQKAFSAAEAGIEQVLKSGSTIASQSLGNNASVNNVSINTVQNTKLLLNNGGQVVQDEGADVWLSTYPTYQNPWTGRVRLYWGTATNCSEAAIEAIVISSGGSYTMTHYNFDPCANRITSAGGNNFSQPAANSSGTINGVTLNYSFPIDVTNAVLIRVIPLYTSTIVGVAGFTNATETTTQYLPSQGQIITATGISNNTQRSISYFQGYAQVPSELFYSLFSP
ncbi:MAG TPA: hypothetical protein VLG12_04285 [Candidatus Saccharimonadales bacterium]|nr:hypothetical protein [Candidatus Saccharimonadales bacterium]